MTDRQPWLLTLEAFFEDHDRQFERYPIKRAELHDAWEAYIHLQRCFSQPTAVKP